MPPPIATAYSVYEKLPPTVIAYPILNHKPRQTLKHRQLRHFPKYKAIWDTSYADEMGCLYQGVGTHPTTPNTQSVVGTNTMHPIHFHDIPHYCISDVTNICMVCKVQPTKAANQTCITIGGNTINFTGDCGTKTASLETVKLLINSTLSSPWAKYMTMNLSNFYLNMPLDRPEYTCIKLGDIPQDIIDEYNLNQYVYNG